MTRPSQPQIKNLLSELRRYYRDNKSGMDLRSKREYWSVFHSLNNVARSPTSTSDSRAALVYRNTVRYLEREMWFDYDNPPPR